MVSKEISRYASQDIHCLKEPQTNLLWKQNRNASSLLLVLFIFFTVFSFLNQPALCTQRQCIGRRLLWWKFKVSDSRSIYSGTETQWTWVWAHSGRWWRQVGLASCNPWGRKQLGTTEGWNSSNKEKPQGRLSGFCMLASSGRAQGYMSCALLYCRTAPFLAQSVFVFWLQVDACVCVCVWKCSELHREIFFLCRFCRCNISAHTAHLLSSLFHLLQLVFSTAVLTLV